MLWDGSRSAVGVVGLVRAVFFVAEKGGTARRRLGLAAWLPPSSPLASRFSPLLLIVEALLILLVVALVVELQEASEDFAAGRLANSEPGTLLGLVKAVAEVEVGPPNGT